VLHVASAADMVSNGLVTNEATIANQPELVARMVGAFDRAVRHTLNNPASAYLASAEYVENLALPEDLRAALEAAAAEAEALLADNPEVDRATMAQRRADLLASLNAAFDPDLLVQFEVMLATADLWEADNIGVSELAAWEATQGVLMQMEFIPAPIDLEAAFTNAFLPARG
jgi:NitT/TauT family transport system substrate-binding protein